MRWLKFSFRSLRWEVAFWSGKRIAKHALNLLGSSVYARLYPKSHKKWLNTDISGMLCGAKARVQIRSLADCEIETAQVLVCSIRRLPLMGRTIKRLLASIFTVVFLISCMACANTESPPRFETRSTPTPPPEFIAFTDESSLFTISYPSDWELDHSLMSVFEGEVKDFLRKKDNELPLEKVGMLFSAGLEDEVGFNPTVNIYTESLGSAIQINEYAELNVETMKDIFETLKINGQTNVVVGGRKGVILDSVIDSSEFFKDETGTMRTLQLIIIDGSVGWLIGCSMIDSDSPAFLQTCEDVIRSFRILE